MTSTSKRFLNKLRKTIALLFLIGISLNISSQNLVPNPSFEQYSSCPTAWDETHLATGWSKYCTSSHTPDYYNTCSPSNTVGIPQSLFLYEEDNRGCDAFMGLATWSTTVTNEREQIGIQLTQPMVLGQKYYLSFYTVRGGFYDNSDCPSNNIGMRLSTIPFSSTSPAPIDNFAHLRSVEIINDTTNWTLVSGEIIADSAYNFLALGNFYDDANTDTTTLTCSTCTNYASYYLVDDICVSTDSTFCNGGMLTFPCNVLVEEKLLKDQMTIYPNPANDYFNIVKNSGVGKYNIILYDAMGQVVYSAEDLESENTLIDISNYSDGFLFIRLESNINSFTYKLLKQ